MNTLTNIWTYNTSANCSGLLYTTSALTPSEKLLLISYLCIPNQGNPEAKILAADASSGYIVWTIDFAEFEQVPGASSDFVVDEQNAYINFGFAQNSEDLTLHLHIFCIDISTGRISWQNIFGPPLQIGNRLDVQIPGPVLDMYK